MHLWEETPLHVKPQFRFTFEFQILMTDVDHMRPFPNPHISVVITVAPFVQGGHVHFDCENS